MDKPRHTFRKFERLTLKRDTDAIFSPGSKSFSAFPLRAIYRAGDFCDTEVKVLMSVGKRHFKHAVDRNRAKRQMREAYRLNKQILIAEVAARNDAATAAERKTLKVAFVWIADTSQSSELVARKMKNLLHRIAESLPAAAKGETNL